MIPTLTFSPRDLWLPFPQIINIPSNFSVDPFPLGALLITDNYLKLVYKKRSDEQGFPRANRANLREESVWPLTNDLSEAYCKNPAYRRH